MRQKVTTLIVATMIFGLGACDSIPELSQFGKKEEPVVAPPPQPAFVAEPGLSSRQRLRKGISLLEKGEAEHARAELLAYLAEKPRSKLVKDLLEQIDADPVAVLGKDHFNYPLKAGESLSLVAGKMLGDRMKFYLLARYNGMANPSQVKAGQIIKVPGRAPTVRGSTLPSAPDPKPPVVQPPEPPIITTKNTEADKEAARKAAEAARIAEFNRKKKLAALKAAEEKAQKEAAVEAARAAKRKETEKVQALLKEAQGHSDRKSYGDAVTTLEEGLQQYPGKPRIKNLLVATYVPYTNQLIGQGKVREAEAALKRTSELAPNNGKMRGLRNKIGQWKRADELYRIGNDYLKAKAEIDAFNTYASVLKIQPGHSGARQGHSALKPKVTKLFYQEGMTAMHRQDLKTAVKNFDKALAVDPNYNEARVNRSRAQRLIDALNKK